MRIPYTLDRTADNPFECDEPAPVNAHHDPWVRRHFRKGLTRVYLWWGAVFRGFHRNVVGSGNRIEPAGIERMAFEQPAHPISTASQETMVLNGNLCVFGATRIEAAVSTQKRRQKELISENHLLRQNPRSPFSTALHSVESF
jgi:hypothetical protein